MRPQIAIGSGLAAEFGGRRHIVEITPRGKKVLERAERGMDKLEQELLSALSPSERATLKQLVRRVLESQAASARQPEAARP